ncbi:hypothetical protein Tco_1144720 [Tanacetum coccineum]
MARQCTKTKRPRNSVLFKEKAMLAEALESGVVLDEERMAFLADNRDTITTGQQSYRILTPTAFQVVDFENHIHSLKLQLNATVGSHKTLLTTVDVLKMESKAKEDKYLKEITELEKKKKTLDNVVYKMGQSMQTMHITGILVTISKPIFEIPPVQPEPVLKEIPHELPTIRFEHVRKAFEKDVNPFVNNLKEYFQMFDKGLFKELTEMREVFNQMKTKVAKCSVDKKYVDIEKKEQLIENDRLLEHIICQDIMSIVMHADIESKNVLPVNNQSLEYVNLEVEMLKKENDRLLELIISQDLVHTAVNSLAAIIDYQSMQKSYLDKYNENLELQSELSKRNNMVEKAVYNELSKKCARLEN